MIRPFAKQDKPIYLELIDEFYHTSAVSHAINPANYQLAFDAITQNSPYFHGFIIEQDGNAAGFAQTALTFSAEAGGIVVWLEELYIRPAFQSHGLGKDFFAFMYTYYKDTAVRFRLEVDFDNARAISLYEKLGYKRMPYIPMYLETKNNNAE